MMDTITKPRGEARIEAHIARLTRLVRLAPLTSIFPTRSDIQNAGKSMGPAYTSKCMANRP